MRIGLTSRFKDTGRRGVSPHDGIPPNTTKTTEITRIARHAMMRAQELTRCRAGPPLATSIDGYGEISFPRALIYVQDGMTWVGSVKRNLTA